MAWSFGFRAECFMVWSVGFKGLYGLECEFSYTWAKLPLNPKS